MPADIPGSMIRFATRIGPIVSGAKSSVSGVIAGGLYHQL